MKSLSNARRGRPNHEDLARRIQEGRQATQGDHKCRDCERTFPRRKSLIAHQRTHTGEKPYPCTFPGCSWSFKQSGQLKTHIGRHTGILPFKCTISECSTRFLHNNRLCKLHGAKVKSDGKLVWGEIPNNLTPEKRAWIIEHRAQAEAQKGGEPRVSPASPWGMPLREISSDSPSTENQSYVSQRDFSIAIENEFGNLRQRAQAEAQKGEPRVSPTSPWGMPLREISSNSPSTENQSYVSQSNFSIAMEKDFGNLRHVRTRCTSSESSENNHGTHYNLYNKGYESPDSGNYERMSSSSEYQNFTELSDIDSSNSAPEVEDKLAGRIDSSDSAPEVEDKFAGRTLREKETSYTLIDMARKARVQAETPKEAEPQNFVFQNNCYAWTKSDF